LVAATEEGSHNRESRFNYTNNTPYENIHL
jgi:hypothetical protein